MTADNNRLKTISEEISHSCEPLFPSLCPTGTAALSHLKGNAIDSGRGHWCPSQDRQLKQKIVSPR